MQEQNHIGNASVFSNSLLFIMGSSVYLGTNYLVHWFKCIGNRDCPLYFFLAQLLLEQCLSFPWEGSRALRTRVSQTRTPNCPHLDMSQNAMSDPQSHSVSTPEMPQQGWSLFTAAQPCSIWAFPPSPVDPKTHVPTPREVLIPGTGAALDCPQLSCFCLRWCITPRLCDWFVENTSDTFALSEQG